MAESLPFHVRLRVAIAKKEMTQTEVAERIGVQSRYMNNMVRGVNPAPPRVDVFFRLAELLDVDVYYLWGVTDVYRPYRPFRSESEEDG